MNRCLILVCGCGALFALAAAPDTKPSTSPRTNAAPASAGPAENDHGDHHHPPAKISAAQPQLDALKTLEGDWTCTTLHSAETSAPPQSVTYRVTAAKSAVIETLFAGTEHEMVTVYYLDGDSLALTHYCAVGNHPHMKAGPAPGNAALAAGQPIVIKFACSGAGHGTNMTSEDELHMHALELAIKDKNHAVAKWTLHEDQKPLHEEIITMTRTSEAD